MSNLSVAPTSVYQYFDSNGQLLYVGVTARGFSRGKEHERTKPWWLLVASSTVEHFVTRDEALNRESYLIKYWRPPHNTIGKPDGPPRFCKSTEPLTPSSGSPPAIRTFFGHLSRLTAITPYEIQVLLEKSGVFDTNLVLDFMQLREANPTEPVGQLRDRLKRHYRNSRSVR